MCNPISDPAMFGLLFFVAPLVVFFIFQFNYPVVSEQALVTGPISAINGGELFLQVSKSNVHNEN
jgi:hypothetical protein